MNLCSKLDRPRFFLSNLKTITPGFFCLVTFFLLFFTNETRSLWRKWLYWSFSKTRDVGRCVLFGLRHCKLSFRRKEQRFPRVDQVIPATNVNTLSTLTLVSAASLNAAQDLPSYETRATSLHERTSNDIIITQL